MNELEPGYNPENDETEPSQGFDIPKILELLSYSESEEMQHTRSLLVEAIRAGNEPERIALYNEYCNQMETFIMNGSKLAVLQIAGDIAVASIFKEAGDIGRYIEELNNALEYANGLELSDLVIQIETEIAAYQ